MLKAIAGMMLASAPVWAQPGSQPIEAVPGSQPVQAEAVPASQPIKAPGSQPVAPPAEPQTLKGKLTHHPIPNTKSVEAYEGVAFRLDGQPVAPSETVTYEALEALDGKTVELVCTMRAGAVPGDRDSYPINRDGSPAPRPAQCVVSAIKAL